MIFHWTQPRHRALNKVVRGCLASGGKLYIEEEY